MTLQSILLPRPVDFLVKGVLSFALGVGVALAEGYLARHPGALRTNEFQGAFDLHTPLHELNPVLFALAWFLIQAFLVEQAKYTWNDIRDHQRDQQIPLNRRRPLAREPITRATYVMLALRWGGGLVLASLLDRGLFAIVLCLSLLQILYEYGAKPASARIPVLVLLLAASSGAVRFLGGAMAVGAAVDFGRLWLYGLSILALGAVGVAAIWRAEATYFAGIGMPLPKPHSAYFKEKGTAWMWAGATVVVASVMMLIGDALAPQMLSHLPAFDAGSAGGALRWALAAIPIVYLALLAVMYGIYLSRTYASIARVEPVAPSSEPHSPAPLSEKVGAAE